MDAGRRDDFEAEMRAVARESGVTIVDRGEGPGLESRAPRASVTLAVNVQSESNFYAGFTENISECGIFVATHAPLRVGSKVELAIALPHEEMIHARGTVRWLRPFSDSTETPPGMGIRFDDLSSEDMSRIRRFTEARAPMFFDDETVTERMGVLST